MECHRTQLTKFLEPLLEQIVFAQLPVSLGALRDRVYLVSGRAAEAAANGGVLAGGVPPPPPPPSAEQQVSLRIHQCLMSPPHARKFAVGIMRRITVERNMRLRDVVPN